MKPYYEDDLVTLFHGDVMELLPVMPKADAIITDPPYAETSLDWDVWPEGWPSIAAQVSDQMWCFGSFRMFMERYPELACWRMAQDVIWEKHNGSNCSSDRFRRVHELAVHFYKGDWQALYHDPQYTYDAEAKRVTRKRSPAHWGQIGESSYATKEGGPRLMRSVIYAKSCHGYAVNETQKPEDVIAPLVMYSVPPEGLVIDCFAGSGTTLAVARKTGRKAIGIEKRESQCEKIVERLSQCELMIA